MERTPLMTDRTEYSSMKDAKGSLPRIQRPALRSSISYDQLPSSVSGYLGENYHCTITPPRGSRNENIENKESSSESIQLVPQLIERQGRRPKFICMVTLIDIAILTYSCVVGPVEKIGITPILDSKAIPVFGFINNHSIPATEKVSVYRGLNVFIGPNASFLVRLGALFTPCIRKEKVIIEYIKQRKKSEESYKCCSYNGECGMMNTSRCAFPRRVIGNVTACTLNDTNCMAGITVRPCCTGLHAKCQIMSEEKCLYIEGRWHRNKLLCSDVNCLDHTCGMTGAQQTHGDQGYRLFTPIFIHIGVLHLLANLIFQVVFGVKIEKEIGTVRTTFIYLISGVGGNLFCGIFTPLLPEVGASGALYGFLALMLVLYIRYYSVLRKPFLDLCGLITIISLSFAMGTLPYIGNFVHIGGFLFGVLTSILLLPANLIDGVTVEHFWRDLIAKGIALSLLIILTVAGFILLYLRDSDFCPGCQYVDCIHWSANFCPGVSHDGILNSDEG